MKNTMFSFWPTPYMSGNVYAKNSIAAQLPIFYTTKFRCN